MKVKKLTTDSSGRTFKFLEILKRDSSQAVYFCTKIKLYQSFMESGGRDWCLHFRAFFIFFMVRGVVEGLFTVDMWKYNDNINNTVLLSDLIWI